MDQSIIGKIAGDIWNYLNEKGETDTFKIKLDLNLNNSLLFLALGWLLRENKISIREEKNNYLIKLI